MVEDGKKEDHLTIGKNFNDFFLEILDLHLQGKFQNQIADFLKCKNPRSIFLHRVTVKETTNIILSLKDSSPGWDNVSKGIIINILNIITVPLTHILNLSITQGVFPKEVKFSLPPLVTNKTCKELKF